MYSFDGKAELLKSSVSHDPLEILAQETFLLYATSKTVGN